MGKGTVEILIFKKTMVYLDLSSAINNDGRLV